MISNIRLALEAASLQWLEGEKGISIQVFNNACDLNGIARSSGVKIIIGDIINVYTQLRVAPCSHPKTSN